MTVWIIDQRLRPEDEGNILSRPGVFLPFEGIPDLSLVGSQSQCRDLLQALHPDNPPETTALMVDRIWRLFSGISNDDTVATLLPAKKSVVLARVNGRYKYNVGDGGIDQHIVPVEWYANIIPLSSFGKFKYLFLEAGQPMLEVTDKDARIKILEKLPHSYNRFAKWKWILIFLLMMQGLSFLINILKH